MANAAAAYVVPSGRYLFKGLTGEDPSGNQEWRGAADIFNTGDPRGSFGSVTDAWNAQRLGYGIMDAPEALQAGMLEARGRYLGGPNNANWSDRWNQWNATDVQGPDGQTLLSPMHQTGLRVGQDYGVGRNAQGQLAGPAGGDIFKGFTFAQNKLAQNPYLDPTQNLAGYNAAMTQSPFATADPAEYLSQMQGADPRAGMAAIGNNGVEATMGLGRDANFDQYGLRGIDQTNDLARANLRQLTKGIDTEAQNSLAMKLPEIQQAMEAAGLGRSGAGQLQMQQTMEQVLGQANRDKQRTMADFTDREANRQAQAINLATQQGYGGEGQRFGANTGAVNLATQLGGQGQMQYGQQQGDAITAGLQDRNAANMIGRSGASQLWQQAMDQQSQRYGQDTQNYLNALQYGGQFQNAALDQERLGQQASLQDWLGLQANRNQTQQDSMSQYLGLSNAYRGIEQERLNQMLQSGMMPLDMLLRISTGTTTPASPQGGSRSFFDQIGAQAAGGVASGAGNAMGEYLGGFLS